MLIGLVLRQCKMHVLNLLGHGLVGLVLTELGHSVCALGRLIITSSWAAQFEGISLAWAFLIKKMIYGTKGIIVSFIVPLKKLHFFMKQTKNAEKIVILQGGVGGGLTAEEVGCHIGERP